ncbi:dnaJ homolog subfamily C member 7-like [Abrus precatorius]|uniref:DnaJ homolog subfamily C member 7-like n=1 Tax=Abrus precatorius TaxID=3816 RepID=A0A8B8LYL9_ABRPR|nr:dnaJ homolog subfamily C member 7-like [Abrus precatorius]
MEKNLNLASQHMSNMKIEKNKDENDDEFVFSAKQHNSASSFIEFKTPQHKTNMFCDANDRFKFSAKKEKSSNTRMNKNKPKLKLSTPTQLWQGHNEYREVVGTEKEEENDICGDDDQHDQVETGSLKSVNDEMDIKSDLARASAQTETTLCSSVEAHDGCDSGSRNVIGFGFTFSASSAAAAAEVESSSLKRHPRKKNWVKVDLGHHHDTYNSTANMKLLSSLSSVTCSQFSGSSSLFTSGQDQKANVCASQPKTKGSEVNEEQRIKVEPASISASTIAAEEACEKWRLKGNQAYKNGNLSVAEDCYTRGVNCASKEAASERGRRALMLCYSNRAATRMSLGRMRDAVEDCMLAAEIDPNFLKVQLRAANCFLALGEVEDATKYFKSCLQSGTDVCVDPKFALEVSDLLQKTQKISELFNHSDELLQRRTAADVERALEQINEALIISSYSEKLLEMKAEALFMLCRYEEVIQLCDETLASAEKNSYPLDADCKVTDLDSSELSKGFYFRLWRSSIMLKSYFHLGKLEEGLALMEQPEEKVSAINKSGGKVLESLIPLAVTIRELLRHKIAGNEAFQGGRHEEAVEHYTAALSCNVESLPFAAVCFCNRAAAFKALGQITDAIADCNLAIALDGRYFKALSRRATLYEMIRDYDQAASDIRRVVSLLMKGDEDTSNLQLHGTSDRSINYANDLKHNQIWLSEIEEEARKGIPLDMYLILGVEHSVSSSEIKRAYHKAALRHHPDKAGQILARSDGGDDHIWKDIVEEVCKDADRLFKLIGEAYAVLSDTAKRSQYDSEEEMRHSQKICIGNSMARNNAKYPL